MAVTKTWTKRRQPVYGLVLIAIGSVLIVSTTKLPTWVGGPAHRYAVDEGSVAMITRSSWQRLGTHRIVPGMLLWLLDG
jgi:hypothetical protein